MGQTIVKLFCGKRELKIVIHGLESAGKTTILYRLKLGKVVTTIPTAGLNVECLEYKNVKFTAWDLSKFLPIWRYYYENTDALIFVVDSNDPEKFRDLREKIKQTLSLDELRICVVAIVANKQDLPNAVPIIDVARLLEIDSIQKSHTCEIFATSALKGNGLYEVLEWVSSEVTYKKIPGEAANQITNTQNVRKSEVSDTSYLTK